MPPPAVDLADKLVERLLHEWVEPVRRLVENEEVGLVHEGLDEPDLLPIAPGELLDPTVEVEIEPFGEQLAAVNARQTAQMSKEAKELPRRQPLVEAQVAGQIAKPAANLDTIPRRIEAEDAEAPAGRPDQVEHEPDRRRLSGAVRTEEPEDLAGLDREVEIDDSPVLAVELRQLLGLQDLRHVVSQRLPRFERAPRRRP